MIGEDGNSGYELVKETARDFLFYFTRVCYSLNPAVVIKESEREERIIGKRAVIVWIQLTIFMVVIYGCLEIADTVGQLMIT